jgi:integrase
LSDLNRRPTVYKTGRSIAGKHRMTLHSSLHTWAALRAGVVKPRTRDYHRELIEFIGRKWPEKLQTRVIEITDQDLGVFIGRIEPLSDTRFNGIVTMLRGTVPRAKNLRRRRLQIKERPLLNQLEFSRLLMELDRRPRSCSGLVIRFLAHTGLRIEEARRLKWSDVHEDSFLVPGAATKNGRPRVIPFVNGIRGVLGELRGTGAGELILPQAECKRSLQTACRRAGLPRLSHHSFRHHFATRCIESGVDVPTVARWLGHQDGGALLGRTYFHLVDEHSRKMAGRVRI